MGFLTLSRTIRSLLPEVETLNDDLQLELLKIAINDDYKENINKINKLAVSTKISRHTLLDICGMMINMVKLCKLWRPKDFQETLQELGVSSKLIDNILAVVHSVPSSDLMVPLDSPDVKIEEIRWRLDLSLLDSKFESAPIMIHLSISLSDGSKIIFSMDKRKFHNLRYNVIVLAKQFLMLKNSHNKK